MFSHFVTEITKDFGIVLVCITVEHIAEDNVPEETPVSVPSTYVYQLSRQNSSCDRKAWYTKLK